MHILTSRATMSLLRRLMGKLWGRHLGRRCTRCGSRKNTGPFPLPLGMHLAGHFRTTCIMKDHSSCTGASANMSGHKAMVHLGCVRCVNELNVRIISMTAEETNLPSLVTEPGGRKKRWFGRQFERKKRFCRSRKRRFCAGGRETRRQGGQAAGRPGGR